MLVRKLLKKRIEAKKKIYSIFLGWRTRKIINSLAKEILEFVNTEDMLVKLKAKRNFHTLYENVVKNSLWLTKNHYRLQRLQNLQR